MERFIELKSRKEKFVNIVYMAQLDFSFLGRLLQKFDRILKLTSEN